MNIIMWEIVVCCEKFCYGIDFLFVLKVEGLCIKFVKWDKEEKLGNSFLWFCLL